MRFCLAFMFQNELPWLKLHLPVLLKSDAIDGIVAVDGGSTDGGDNWLMSFGADVKYRRWDWKPCDQENAVIALAEEMGYDAMLLTAPDELLFPRDIDFIRTMVSVKAIRAIGFDTFNFVRDRQHFARQQPFYPDWHVRAWRLGEGIRHVGALDSTPNVKPEDVTYFRGIHLFHYSHIKDRRFYAWKGQNFHRVKDGLPPLDLDWTKCSPAPYPECIAFEGMQPLDPYEIGIRAPVE